jgi:soluble lytic murein transglycosylase-like protein
VIILTAGVIVLEYEIDRRNAVTYNIEKILLENVQRYTPELTAWPNVNFYALMKAHMKIESDFNPDAVKNETNVGDFSIGLGQLRIATARGLYDFSGKSNDEVKAMLLDGRFNAYLMGKYIVQQIKRYNGRLSFIISAYNAGSAMFKIDGKIVYYDNRGFFVVSHGLRVDVSDEYDELHLEIYPIANKVYVNAVMKYYNQYSEKKTR